MNHSIVPLDVSQNSRSRSPLSHEGRTLRLVETLTWRLSQLADEIHVVESLLARRGALVARDLFRLVDAYERVTAASDRCPSFLLGAAGAELVKVRREAKRLETRYAWLCLRALPANDNRGAR